MFKGAIDTAINSLDNFEDELAAEIDKLKEQIQKTDSKKIAGILIDKIQDYLRLRFGISPKGK